MYRKIISLIIFLVSTCTYSQIDFPDYSKLPKKEKLRLMNVYGFIELKKGDTIFAKVLYDKQTGIPITSSDNKLIVNYPKDLEKYQYLKEIPLESIYKFYYGFPRRRFNEVQKKNKSFLLLEKIVKGKFTVYEENISKGSGRTDFMTSNSGMNVQTSMPLVETTLYISNEENKLVCITGNKEERREILRKILNKELSSKKLDKIKTKNDKLIELFKKLNAMQ